MSETDEPIAVEVEQPDRNATDEEVHGRPRRNIVLLSDGTGNSAAKLNKTNVWRLYQALDLGQGDQIAFYDDGVGTSGFKILQLLGGAFGWGLSRNVRDLYEFLCRHYQVGDRVYIFGFSRGAFTARTLAALIGSCGVIDGTKSVPQYGLFSTKTRHLRLNTREGLKVGVKLAYRSYRRGYWAPVAALYRRMRDLLLPPVPSPDAFRAAYSIDHSAKVAFVGVWDTVDAVAVPVDELSTLIDRVIYPHRAPDQDLSPRVDRACHAIALDDERSTFHPVLWNERGTADSERIKQVWFAGMHSNVGGGYPDDDLARVPLMWMIDEVKFDADREEGLRFSGDSLRDIAHRAQPLGKIYDSRRGLAVYYRYKPRHVGRLSHDRDAGVEIAEPKIHHSVLDRIAENTTSYAPAGLPASYRVVDAHGALSELNPTKFESDTQRQERSKLLERAQDHIFWRQVVYYAFVVVTLGLVLMPYYSPPDPEPHGWLQTSLAWVLNWVPALLPGFLSAWAEKWTSAWSQSPILFLLLLAIYGWLWQQSHVIGANTQRLSELAWWHVKRRAGNKPSTPPVGTFERLAARCRRSDRLSRLSRLTARWAVPAFAALAGSYLIYYSDFVQMN